MCDEKTIKKWAAGRKVYPSSAHRIWEACRELGIPLLPVSAAAVDVVAEGT